MTVAELWPLHILTFNSTESCSFHFQRDDNTHINMCHLVLRSKVLSGQHSVWFTANKRKTTIAACDTSIKQGCMDDI